MTHGRSFSQFDEDAYRLPEDMQRIAYDTDTQQYTFRDRSGRLYESAPGSRYGVLIPTESPLAHRRNVTITEIPDPALRQWSEKPAKTFDDILPSGYMTTAQSGVPESPTRVIASGKKWAQAVMPKVQGVVEVVRRHTTMRKPRAAGMGSRTGAGAGTRAVTGPMIEKGAETGARGRARSRTWVGTWDVKRMDSLVEEKCRLLEDEDGWEIVRRSDDAVDERLARFKSEIRPSRYALAGRK